ncbi:MAG: zinc ABC transporter substrate-binding protein [Chloroflexota bacterium]|nr:zinc ABC transporter substrate-binding protein [Chloroflexota bacterium]
MKTYRIGRPISIALVLVLAVAGFAIACGGGEETEAEGRIGVIVTILPQADFAERVGGEKVNVTVMVPPGASPHTFEPTPSQLEKVSKARMYAKVGSGVEFELAWMDKIIGQNKNMLIVDCSKDITRLGNDPHIWNSPVNAKRMVQNICAGLIEADPDHADFYTENKNSYLKELDALDRYIHERLDGFTNRHFMIYHPSFGYFADEYNLKQLAVEHGGKPPMPKVFQDCIDKANEYNLSYVFVAPQFATQHAETVANSINGKTVFTDPLPRLYIANMRSVTGALAVEME